MSLIAGFRGARAAGPDGPGSAKGAERMRKIDTPNELVGLLADSIPGLIAFLDHNLEYHFLNVRYREWFGIDPDSFIGKTPRDLLGAQAFEAAKPYFDRALAGERVVQEMEMNYRFGGKRDVRFYLIPHKSPEGRMLGLCAMVLDITAELKTRERLEEATRSKSRFLAAASHDLRQPLHALTLLTHALRRRTQNVPEAAEMLEHMTDALTSLRRMFEALLDVSRLDSGLMKTETRPTALKPALRAVCQKFAGKADAQNLRFSLLPIDAYVDTDPAILEMTLSNLIANALKFTAHGGILVGARRRGEMIRIEVYDTGPGIPAERIGAIFDEFERGNASASGANDGMGLGLALVRRYSDLMGYELEVRATPGRGSRFSISLPEVARREEKPRAFAGHDSARLSLKGARILVLDDERHVTFALARDLKDQGAEVFSTERLEEAEALLNGKDWPDAAIVDYDLRRDEMGNEFVARMETAARRKLPTLLITGSTDPDSLKALAASGRRWLTKPVDPEVLSAAVAGLVRD